MLDPIHPGGMWKHFLIDLPFIWCPYPRVGTSVMQAGLRMHFNCGHYQPAWTQPIWQTGTVISFYILHSCELKNKHTNFFPTYLEQFTSICTQWVAIIPTTKIPARPNWNQNKFNHFKKLLLTWLLMINSYLFTIQPTEKSFNIFANNNLKLQNIKIITTLTRVWLEVKSKCHKTFKTQTSSNKCQFKQ